MLGLLRAFHAGCAIGFILQPLATESSHFFKLDSFDIWNDLLMLSDGRDGSMNVILDVILSIQQLRVSDYCFFIGTGIEAGFGLWRSRYQIILGSLAGLNGLFKGV